MIELLDKPHIRGLSVVFDSSQQLDSDDLAERAEVSHHVINDLIDRSLLIETDTGIKIGDTRAAREWRRTAQELNHVDLYEVLGRHELLVASSIGTDEQSREELEEELDSEVVEDGLDTLQLRALVRNTGNDTYAFRQGTVGIGRFARALVRDEWGDVVRDMNHRAVVLWCSPSSCLALSDDHDGFEESNLWSVTGSARFAEEGVELLLTEQRLWYYDNHDDVGVEAAAAHKLFEDASVRPQTYVLLVAEAAPAFSINTFQRHAERLGIDTALVEMVRHWTEDGELTERYDGGREKLDEKRAQYGLLD